MLNCGSNERNITTANLIKDQGLDPGLTACYAPYPTGKISRGSWDLLIFMTRITSLS